MIGAPFFEIIFQYFLGILSGLTTNLLFSNFFEKFFAQGENAQSVKNEMLVQHQNSLNKELHRLIINHFNQEEVKTLCFALNVQYDNLSGNAHPDKVRELVQLFQRQQRIKELLQEVSEARPNIGWPDPFISLSSIDAKRISRNVFFGNLFKRFAKWLYGILTILIFFVLTLYAAQNGIGSRSSTPTPILPTEHTVHLIVETPISVVLNVTSEPTRLPMIVTATFTTTPFPTATHVVPTPTATVAATSTSTPSATATATPTPMVSQRLLPGVPIIWEPKAELHPDLFCADPNQVSP